MAEKLIIELDTLKIMQLACTEMVTMNGPHGLLSRCPICGDVHYITELGQCNKG